MLLLDPCCYLHPCWFWLSTCCTWLTPTFGTDPAVAGIYGFAKISADACTVAGVPATAIIHAVADVSVSVACISAAVDTLLYCICIESNAGVADLLVAVGSLLLLASLMLLASLLFPCCSHYCWPPWFLWHPICWRVLLLLIPCHFDVHICTHWLRAPPLIPPHLVSYTRALLVSQDRRHLFMTPCSLPSMSLLLLLSCLYFCWQLFLKKSFMYSEIKYYRMNAIGLTVFLPIGLSEYRF